MKRLLYIFSVFLYFFCFPAVGEPLIQADLVASKNVISNGEDFFVALKLSLPKGWHVYWKNAGDAGEAIELKVNLPDGFSEKERLWLTPEKFVVGSFAEYGYQNEAYLLVKIAAPSEMKKDDIFEISGHATWLACRDECVPMEADVAVFVSAGETSQIDEDVAKVLENVPEKTEKTLFFETDRDLVLKLPVEQKFSTVYFFPFDADRILHSGVQKLKEKDGFAFLFMPKPAAEDYAARNALQGVAVFYDKAGKKVQAVQISAEKTKESLPAFPLPFSFSDCIGALFFAFFGGILLNVMPCVFPVLSLKAFNLVSNGQRKKDGLFYTAGILAAFLTIGGILVVLRGAGSELGWGFQLQYPPFVFVLAVFIFFLGLLFSDIVSVGDGLSALGDKIPARWGNFGTGILAVLVATPCAAPFMGTALGYGLTQPAVVTLSVFAAMGTGLAFPFLALDFWPVLGRFLPKPGAWMETFRHFLAFPLYATAGWLVWVLTAQAGQDALGTVLGAFVLSAMTAWLFSESLKVPKIKILAFISAVLSAAFIVFSACDLTPQAREKEKRISWQPYDMVKIEDYRKADVPVFVKFSAKWCLTCLMNEKTALSSERIAKTFSEKGIAAFSADWTNRDDNITAVLETFGRGGIPLYLYYPPNAEKPVVLPQLITEKMLTDLFSGL